MHWAPCDESLALTGEHMQRLPSILGRRLPVVKVRDFFDAATYHAGLTAELDRKRSFIQSNLEAEIGKLSSGLHPLCTFTMRHLAAPLCALLILSSSNAHAAPGSRCVNDDFLLHRDTLKTAKVTLPVFVHFCYRDKSGDYVVYLTESDDRRYEGETLSSKIGAYLFKINSWPTLAARGTVSDSAPEGEAGVRWWSTLTELDDIDGDGLVDPILVHRFHASDDNGEMQSDPFEGRLKIIVFHRDTKAAIRAITGDLDGQRSTTASPPYFKLPPVLQTHLVRKMKRMYDERQFEFDNSYGFKPRK